MSSVRPVERELGLYLTMADRYKPKLVVQTRSPDVVRRDLFRRIVAQDNMRLLPRPAYF